MNECDAFEMDMGMVGFCVCVVGSLCVNMYVGQGWACFILIYFEEHRVCNVAFLCVPFVIFCIFFRRLFLRGLA